VLARRAVLVVPNIPEISKLHKFKRKPNVQRAAFANQYPFAGLAGDFHFRTVRPDPAVGMQAAHLLRAEHSSINSNRILNFTACFSTSFFPRFLPYRCCLLPFRLPRTGKTSLEPADYPRVLVYKKRAAKGALLAPKCRNQHTIHQNGQPTFLPAPNLP